VSFVKWRPPVGARPGTLAIPEGSPPPEVHLVSWSPEAMTHRRVDDDDALREPPPEGAWSWVDVRGLGDEARLRRIAEIFAIDALALEDAVNVPQRAKVQEHTGHLLVVARIPCIDDEGGVATPQVCFLVGPRHLVTFQERYFGFFDAVRRRLDEGVGPIRHRGPDYLAYALVDAAVDHYYPVVESLSDELDRLEEAAVDAADPDVLARIHQVRRQVALVRRVGWPQREAVGQLARAHQPHVSAEVRDYFRDTEGHIAQIMELADSLREMAVGLTEIFMTQVSHRTNEIMKVLTLMASIFIPLTFMAGIYGMNFENMPELQSRWGYPLLLGSMVAVAAAMTGYFRRRGWLGRRRR
jgi:magnesium transporter